jgi:hypothetical protein
MVDDLPDDAISIRAATLSVFTKAMTTSDKLIKKQSTSIDSLAELGGTMVDGLADLTTSSASRFAEINSGLAEIKAQVDLLVAGSSKRQRIDTPESVTPEETSVAESRPASTNVEGNFLKLMETVLSRISQPQIQQQPYNYQPQMMMQPPPSYPQMYSQSPQYVAHPPHSQFMPHEPTTPVSMPVSNHPSVTPPMNTGIVQVQAGNFGHQRDTQHDGEQVQQDASRIGPQVHPGYSQHHPNPYRQ